MMRLDLFTQKRLMRFIEEFRRKSGVLPTLKDFVSEGFEREIVEQALKDNVIERFYVTLSNGTIVKGFKVRQ